ncbi:hypothetical protein ACJJTC_014711 [Scirpophaga incertulas]
MSGRLFFSWRMFAAARDRDNLIFSINRNARARGKLNPVSDLSGSQFRRRYRLTKEMFKRLCQELKQNTNLRSSQRVSIEIKEVLTALFFYASGSYQRPVGVAKHLCQKICRSRRAISQR